MSAVSFTMTAKQAQKRLKDVLNRINTAAKDQDSSRFLQWRLSDNICDDGERDEIFEALLPNVASLTADEYGNFVVQRLIERSTPEQRTAIVDKLYGNVFSLSIDKHGCRVVQRMLELLPSDEQAYFVSELEARVMDCIDDMHGNHVMQSICKVMKGSSIDFVLAAVAGATEKMAVNQFGCRIIQRLVERSGELASGLLDDLVHEVVERAAQLASDRHGNYVVQCILQYGTSEAKSRVIEAIRNDLVKFAKSKLSSNVVEKCFEAVCTGEDAGSLSVERAALYRTVLDNPTDKNSPLRQLVNDKFGNYAVQRMIKHSRGEDREELREALTAMEPELRNHSTGRHILSCLKQLDDE